MLTIGCTGIAVGHVSGEVFNPAVAVGAMVMGVLPWGKLWLYIAAELLAGAAAALVFRSIHPDYR